MERRVYELAPRVVRQARTLAAAYPAAAIAIGAASLLLHSATLRPLEWAGILAASLFGSALTLSATADRAVRETPDGLVLTEAGRRHVLIVVPWSTLKGFTHDDATLIAVRDDGTVIPIPWIDATAPLRWQGGCAPDAVAELTSRLHQWRPATMSSAAPSPRPSMAIERRVYAPSRRTVLTGWLVAALFPAVYLGYSAYAASASPARHPPALVAIGLVAALLLARTRLRTTAQRVVREDAMGLGIVRGARPLSLRVTPTFTPWADIAGFDREGSRVWMQLVDGTRVPVRGIDARDELRWPGGSNPDPIAELTRRVAGWQARERQLERTSRSDADPLRPTSWAS